jgi:hypothetical protein
MMEEYFIDVHSDFCTGRQSKDAYSEYCQHNPERFLFYLKGRFFIIIYYPCLNGYGERYAFKAEIISKIIEKNKIFPLWKVETSINLERDLKSFRIKNVPLRKNVKEVNYIYADAADKKYCIATTVNYLDTVCNSEEIDKNYKEAKEYITKKGYDWLLYQLDELYKHNWIGDADDNVITCTIDTIVKIINKQTI